MCGGGPEFEGGAVLRLLMQLSLLICEVGVAVRFPGFRSSVSWVIPFIWKRPFLGVFSMHITLEGSLLAPLNPE